MVIFFLFFLILLQWNLNLKTSSVSKLYLFRNYWPFCLCINFFSQELAEKVQRYEHKVKSIQSHAESQLGSLQTSLDQERASAAENLKAKMMEMRTNNLDALDRLRKEHASERRRLERTVEALQRKATGVHTYTQVGRRTGESIHYHWSETRYCWL